MSCSSTPYKNYIYIYLFFLNVKILIKNVGKFQKTVAARDEPLRAIFAPLQLLRIKSVRNTIDIMYVLEILDMEKLTTENVLEYACAGE